MWVGIRSLLEQIQSQAIAAEAIPKSEDQHGQRDRVDLEVVGTENQRAIIRSGWIVQPENLSSMRLCLIKLRQDNKSRYCADFI